MPCKYCREETLHLKGCPEIVTDMSKERAIREFEAGGMSGCVMLGMRKNPSDSYKLGYELGVKDFSKPENAPNC